MFLGFRTSTRKNVTLIESFPSGTGNKGINNYRKYVSEH